MIFGIVFRLVLLILTWLVASIAVGVHTWYLGVMLFFLIPNLLMIFWKFTLQLILPEEFFDAVEMAKTLYKNREEIKQNFSFYMNEFKQFYKNYGKDK